MLYCVFYNTCCLEKEGSQVNLNDKMDFDPAYPPVLLLVCKWYGKELDVAKLLLSLYVCLMSW